MIRGPLLAPRSLRRTSLGAALAAGVALALAACGEPDPLREISAKRLGYDVRVGSFVVKEGGGEATGQEVVLDLLIRRDGKGSLPGLTVDLSIADSSGREKARRQVWVETADLAKGSEKAVSVSLADLGYAAGDGFWAEIRHPVAESELAAYREYAAAR